MSAVLEGEGFRVRRATEADVGFLVELADHDAVEPFMAAVSARGHDELLEEVRRGAEAFVASLTADPEAGTLFWHAVARYAAAPGDHANALQGAIDDSGWPPARLERLLAPVRARLAAQGAVERAQLEAAAAVVGLEVHELLALAVRRLERTDRERRRPPGRGGVHDGAGGVET